MTQDIHDFVPASGDLLALGEPTHQEPACGRVRNELFAQLAGHGFRSIALETDRIAALTVNDFVQDGAGDLDTVMREGFSHGFGELTPNRQLILWMREYNRNRPPAERLTFHGFDAPLETTSAPSPRRYLTYARDYLGLDLDLDGLIGDDTRWSRTEAVMDPAMSPGATAEAEQLRTLANDMLTTLSLRAPELIAATSHAAWSRARTHLTAGLGLLRYHQQSAQPLDQSARISRLSATRDALMAQNLLDIRDTEAQRGATLVFAHNAHLQRNPSHWSSDTLDLNWSGAGALISPLLGERYTFIAGSLGRSETLGLHEPAPDTYEASLQRHTTTWSLTAPTAIPPARTRTDTTPTQGYFPLTQATLDAADAILHIDAGPASANEPTGTPASTP
ncbi:erythromycin esterase family protein [Streptomyces sp. RPA4-5]|uniref:erythromycin esterase family protein n=1 Tax=Streptomyces sp. RPA4-5 TaxID=2721245 RepID=UPI00143E757A|nr:erythromycin esterase family protein [Streptomyces sp. RPA4-5]QIY56828.1 erythromycin esterase family protein [Streptomyces sp. RPA4-5]